MMDGCVPWLLLLLLLRRYVIRISLPLLSHLFLLKSLGLLFAVYLDVGVQHAVLLTRQHVIEARCLSLTLSGGTSSRRAYLRIILSQIVQLWQIHRVLFGSNAFEDRDREWPGERRVCLAGDGELDIIHVELLLFELTVVCGEACVLFENLSLLEDLCRVVVHKLKQLVHYVLLIVFNTLFLEELLDHLNVLRLHLFGLAVLAGSASSLAADWSAASVGCLLLRRSCLLHARRHHVHLWWGHRHGVAGGGSRHMLLVRHRWLGLFH